MFQMTVEKFMKTHNIVSVSGPCKNRWDFSSKLIDDLGNVYDAYVPLGKDLVIDDSIIMLCLEGEVNMESLKGRVLRSA
jgi:hypothetical protein